MITPLSESELRTSGKTKKVPDIGLSSFVTYKVDGGKFQVYPPPLEETVEVDGRLLVTIGNVPLPPGVPAPSRALTLLYGFRDQLDEMKIQYGLARQKGHDLVKVEFKLQVGTDLPDTKIVMGTASLEDIPKSQFLNVMRLNLNLQRILLDDVNEMLAVEAAKSKKAARYFERMVDAGARPDLLCDVLRKQPIFKHINSVVYSVPDGTPRGRKVCTIFETSSVIDLNIRGELPFDLQLPKL